MIAYTQLNLQESHNNRTLWVAGLNGVSEEEFRTLFEKFGAIENIQIRRPKRKGSRFGLITFTDSQNARQALSHLNHSRINGNKIKIQWNKN